MRFMVATLFLALMPSANSYEVPLYCADSVTSNLRKTDAWLGCRSDEISLGAGGLSLAWEPVSGIHPYLAARFKVAKAVAKAEGVDLYIASGYRSKSRQAYLFAKAKKKYGSYAEAAKWVLPPEISHHPRGLALDINYPKNRSGAQWLEANGARFGLCRLFENEWWHFESPIAPGETCPELLPNATVFLEPEKS